MLLTAVVRSWTDCLATRVADDANTVWTEQLLEHVNQRGQSLRARVEVRIDADSSYRIYALALPLYDPLFGRRVDSHSFCSVTRKQNEQMIL